METYKNSYTKNEDAMLWELHEVRYRLHEENKEKSYVLSFIDFSGVIYFLMAVPSSALEKGGKMEKKTGISFELWVRS